MHVFALLKARSACVCGGTTGHWPHPHSCCGTMLLVHKKGLCCIQGVGSGLPAGVRTT